MTSIEIQLPDGLAREATLAGLLAPGRIAAMLCRQLQTEAFLASLPEMNAAFEPMSTQEIQAEINAVRAEQRRSART
ncbi:hypothetical protein [Mitsuaria sp. GD03876]|uniref:hypothetical protein n=1 Tax=Mitsuaria sp. GD03876 TaxID=2975399 RepID=UPI00244733C5|nr:hypothetical protein [Mitsuaria sp. GD03876]MDH0863756.1 hypothetical protein [Mitsuaria sp. GD03876]